MRRLTQDTYAVRRKAGRLQGLGPDARVRVVDAEQIEPRLRKVCKTEGAALGFELQAMFQSVTDELDFGSYSAADGGT